LILSASCLVRVPAGALYSMLGWIIEKYSVLASTRDNGFFRESLSLVAAVQMSFPCLAGSELPACHLRRVTSPSRSGASVAGTDRSRSPSLHSRFGC
jgi:hypothetical protein